MKTSDNNLERKFLEKLQLLSEKISDLIYKKQFSQIEVLDCQRKIIISSFKHKLSEKSKFALIKILEQNNNLIKQIEHEKVKLSSNYKKVLNIFNAYR